MPSTNFLKLWRPHQSSEISFKKLTNLFNKYLGLGFYLIHSQIPSTYHNASNIVDTHWIPIYWMNVESWKTKQYYELCIKHIRKSHGCLLANDEECRDYGLQTNKSRKTEPYVADASSIPWHILFFGHLQGIRPLSPYFNKRLLKENSINK